MTLGGPRMLKKLDKQIYYTLGHRYIAANDSGLFFLSMGDSAEIYKYSPGDAGPTKLGAVPAAYSNVPVLNGNRNLSGKRDLDIVFEEIRNQRMAVGLYGQGRFLYLLTREPESGEKTKWLLHQIDARAGTVTGRVRLPTSSKNLTIVPAPSAWHVFERGSLSDLDGVRTLITVPAPWITNPRTSPLKDENSGVACRQYDERAKPSSSAAPRASLDHDLDTD